MIKRNDFYNFDYLLVGAVSLLVIIGILSIYSAGFDPIEKINSGLYKKQLIFFVLGLIFMLGISLFSYQQLGEFSWIIYGAVLFVLILTTFFGSTVRGTRAWIHLGFLSLQPSEFMKLATVILLAKYLEIRERELSQFRELLIPTFIVFVPVFFIMLQPDFGTAMVFIPVLFAMLFVGGSDVTHLVSIVIIALISILFPMIITYFEWLGLGADSPFINFFKTGSLPFIISFFLLFIGLVSYVLHVFIIRKYFRRIYIPAFVLSLGLLGAVLFLRFLKEYQKKRILVFLNPDLDPHGSGYNVIQAKIAVGSGGFLGKGFLKGSQTQLGFLPEKWTDFIFAVIAEEWGFIGAILVLVLFAVIIYKGAKTALESKDKYAALLATGITTLIFCHISVNLGMVVGILPVTGLPLSFVSYGGSNLIMCLIGVGIISSISMNKHAN
jgi:rod shape determining protein RodA